jgi:predicted tellurium resistance membrane protein TerC
MGELFTPEGLIALLTLTALEVVLGIDNIVFLAIVTGRIPKEDRPKARRLGLALALIMRIALLCMISFIITLKEPVIEIFGHGLSWKDMILLAGGLFLIGKSTLEIRHRIEPPPEGHPGTRAGTSLKQAVVQIIIIDMVFSIDSIVTAVGMTNVLPAMIGAVVLAMIIMLAFAGTVSNFVEKHPTIKMLALAFLLLIGVLLVAESFHVELDRAYVYFAMGFSLGVEMLSIWASKREAVRRAKAGEATPPTHPPAAHH